MPARHDLDKFPLGHLVATPGALALFKGRGDRLANVLYRHASGDWGDLCATDKRLNDAAVRQGDRILSAYTLDDGRKVWIITEADRSATTVLLPEEY